MPWACKLYPRQIPLHIGLALGSTFSLLGEKEWQRLGLSEWGLLPLDWRAKGIRLPCNHRSPSGSYVGYVTGRPSWIWARGGASQEWNPSLSLPLPSAPKTHCVDSTEFNQYLITLVLRLQSDWGHVLLPPCPCLPVRDHKKHTCSLAR